MLLSHARKGVNHMKIIKHDLPLFINTNGFLNFGGYAENYGYHPTSTQYPKIILDGVERKATAVI